MRRYWHRGLFVVAAVVMAAAAVAEYPFAAAAAGRDSAAIGASCSSCSMLIAAAGVTAVRQCVFSSSRVSVPANPIISRQREPGSLSQ